MSWAIITHIDQGVAADRPAANAVPGRHYGWWSTDTKELSISDGSTWTTIGPGSGGVPTSRTLTAGAALTGGGDLTADRTFDVAVDGSTIEVSSDALRVKSGVFDAAGAAAAAQAASQPLDSDLTAIAALTTTSFGRAFLALADAAAARTAIGTVIGTDVEAHDADLTTIAGLSASNDDVIQRKAGAWTNRTMANLIADLAALGTTFQPLDSDLTSIAALSTSSFGRALLTEASAATARTTLGVIAPWDAIGQVSGSAFTTTSTTLVDITGLSVALLANHTYEIEAVVDIATSNDANGSFMGVNFSTAGATARVIFFGGATAAVTTPVNALNTNSGSKFLTSANAVGICIAKGVVTVGANAGNFTIQTCHGGSGTSTVQIGSILKARLLV